MIKNSCIGIFDSGIGGLTVLKQLKKRMPFESMEYIGDTLNVPYGHKSRERIQSLSYRLIGYLLGKGAKIIVVACNTATAAILPEASGDFQVYIVGPVNSGARDAYSKSSSKRIGVIATESTIGSGIYQKILREIDHDVKVYTQSAPGLVDLVEKGETHGAEASKAVECYLEGFNNKIDTLILGCTHFPFLRKVIEDYLAERGIEIIDPAESLAQNVKSILVQNKLLSSNEKPPSYNYWATDVNKLNKVFLQKIENEWNVSSIIFKQLAF